VAASISVSGLLLVVSPFNTLALRRVWWTTLAARLSFGSALRFSDVRTAPCRVSALSCPPRGTPQSKFVQNHPPKHIPVSSAVMVPSREHPLFSTLAIKLPLPPPARCLPCVFWLAGSVLYAQNKKIMLRGDIARQNNTDADRCENPKLKGGCRVIGLVIRWGVASLVLASGALDLKRESGCPH